MSFRFLNCISDRLIFLSQLIAFFGKMFVLIFGVWTC
jgi:hypothetical protein